jgi:hypothetical protein
MPLRNQLRLGRFDRPMAFILYRRHITDWGAEVHLSVLIAQTLFISQIKHLPDDMFEFVYAYENGYYTNLILQPRLGTAQRPGFDLWEGGGRARNFYTRVPGFQGGRAYLYVSSYRPGKIGDEDPEIGGGGAYRAGYPFIVETKHVGQCIMQALNLLRMNKANQVTVGNFIRIELGKQRRKAGF